ncbi:Asp/Glu racemase, partial [Methylobacterium sp. IIF4SW-B5]|nr:Asp/Glu racemase [Methylobacterium ajmalii]
VICSVEAGARAVIAAAGLAGARPVLPATESVGLSDELARMLRAEG